MHGMRGTLADVKPLLRPYRRIGFGPFARSSPPFRRCSLLLAGHFSVPHLGGE
jgi:hypothetical protein